VNDSDNAKAALTRRRLMQGGLALAAGGSLSRAFATLPDEPAVKLRWTLIETARDNGHRLAELPGPPPTTAEATIQCDPQQRRQEIIGFGGALTESSAYVLQLLSKPKRMQVLRRYFDPVDGIGYTLARTHINSCDFSRSTWALDEAADDQKLRRFSLKPMRERQLPLIRDVQHLVGAGRFRLVASPWSPPAWMKTTGEMARGGALLPNCQPAWADYYVRFVKAMRR